MCEPADCDVTGVTYLFILIVFFSKLATVLLAARQQGKLTFNGN